MMSLLMVATGVGAAAFTSFWPLTIVGFLGTINPSGGDVSAFQPTEQAALPVTTDATRRTALLARYSLIGTLFAAVGAALAGIPEWASHRTGLSLIDAIRWAFARGRAQHGGGDHDTDLGPRKPDGGEVRREQHAHETVTGRTDGAALQEDRCVAGRSRDGEPRADGDHRHDPVRSSPTASTVSRPCDGCRTLFRPASDQGARPRRDRQPARDRHPGPAPPKNDPTATLIKTVRTGRGGSSSRR